MWVLAGSSYRARSRWACTGDGSPRIACARAGSTALTGLVAPGTGVAATLNTGGGTVALVLETLPSTPLSASASTSTPSTPSDAASTQAPRSDAGWGRLPASGSGVGSMSSCSGMRRTRSRLARTDRSHGRSRTGSRRRERPELRRERVVQLVEAGFELFHTLALDRVCQLVVADPGGGQLVQD